MAFDPLSWAIGFALTCTAGRLLKKAGAETFADRLRETVLKWSHGLPEESSDLHPDAVVTRLFEAETIREEVAWLGASRFEQRERVFFFAVDWR
jgi:hypothetical protein